MPEYFAVMRFHRISWKEPRPSSAAHVIKRNSRHCVAFVRAYWKFRLRQSATPIACRRFAIGLINLCHQIGRGSNRDDGFSPCAREIFCFHGENTPWKNDFCIVLRNALYDDRWMLPALIASRLKSCDRWRIRRETKRKYGNVSASFHIFILEIQYLSAFFFLFLHIP